MVKTSTIVKTSTQPYFIYLNFYANVDFDFVNCFQFLGLKFIHDTKANYLPIFKLFFYK